MSKEKQGKKRVVFVFREMGTGGAQKIEAFVADSLLQHGYDVVAINMSPKQITVSIDPRIKIITCDYDSLRLKGSRIGALAEKAGYLLSLRRLIVSCEPDMVCAFLSDVVRVTVLALTGLPVPVIGSERGDPNVFREKKFRAYRAAYTKCAGVVFQLPQVKEKYSLPESVRQAVIPNPCCPRKDQFFRREDTNDHIIFAAGRLCEQKRFDVLIDAFSILYTAHPEYSLRIYGDGHLAEALHRQADASPAGGAIVFCGDTEEVFSDARNAEFFVLSSDYEGIPNVLIEAMASGFPCVSTDCTPGGARFLLKDGERGVLCPCADAEALARAMQLYIDKPDLREENARKGLSIVQELSPAAIRDDWVSFFDEIGKELWH